MLKIKVHVHVLLHDYVISNAFLGIFQCTFQLTARDIMDITHFSLKISVTFQIGNNIMAKTGKRHRNYGYHSFSKPLKTVARLID